MQKYHPSIDVYAEHFDGSEEMRNKYWILHETKRNAQLGINEGDLFYLTSVRGNIEIRVGDWIIVKNENLPVEVMSDWEFKYNYEQSPITNNDTHRKISS
ncbi:hypothetical protein LBR_09680 [Levilactobacillus brevis]|uniref:hypothetical protein n=1 Tax=Levilactobacillus brevis TaxID=1580 RepID=UPI000A109258|nr:hypothetical protein [Levilactobacillus brevis]ORJ54183.1 hypothetical protein LBR_09680 [Levilactobacillus brevis]